MSTDAACLAARINSVYLLVFLPPAFVMNLPFALPVWTLVLAAPGFSQTTWYVDAAAPGPGTGTAVDPFQRIDTAVAWPQVVSGDTVLVEPGVYAAEAIDLAGKDLLIEAAGLPGSVVVEGVDSNDDDAPFMTIDGGSTAGSTIRGLAFESYDDDDYNPSNMIALTSAFTRFEDCFFRLNSGFDLAMIQVTGGSAVFDQCNWDNNDFECPGVLGGLGAEITLRNCEWTLNYNAMFVDGGSLRIEDCDFGFNNNSTSCGSVFGGNTRVRQADLTILRCTFSNSGAGTSKHFLLEDCVTLMDEVTIDGGYTKLGPGAGVDAFGGSLLCTNSSFGNLFSDRGGAASLKGVDATFRDCEFNSNRGDIEDYEGGAIHADLGGTLLVEDCMFQENVSGLGGAMGVNLVPTVVRRCVFQSNVATRGTFFDGVLPHGGALYSRGAATVEECTFELNLAQSTYPIALFDKAYGGALALGPGSYVGYSTFFGNRVEAGEESTGGAIWAEAGTTAERCVFVRNHAGDTANAVGGALGGEGSADHCTFLDNTTKGSYSVADQWAIGSSVLVPEGQRSVLGPLAVVEYSLIEGGWPGTGNLAGNALVWGPHDAHLIPGSPAIDTGDPTGVADLDGSIPDMGAYPYDANYCGPDCSSITGTTYCAATVNSTGAAGRTFVLGSDLANEDNLVLAADQLPAGSLGYFLMSDASSMASLPGGNGVLCLAMPLVRWTSEAGPINAAGQFGRALNLGNLFGVLAVQPGETWYFQLVFQDDAAGQMVTNASSGLSVLFQ